MRIPRHVGIIPDGNRRWAVREGKKKEDGYRDGINPGLEAFRTLRELGVEELTFYGFTADNVKRPAAQRTAFTDACVKAVEVLSGEDAELLVVGNAESKVFPEELKAYVTRKRFGAGGMKVNFLVNYSPEWDLGYDRNRGSLGAFLHSEQISRIDLLIRWGGRRRLSGFLPLQTVYSDIYVIDAYWPDFAGEQIREALAWYDRQDVTLGG